MDREILLKACQEFGHDPNFLVRQNTWRLKNILEHSRKKAEKKNDNNNAQALNDMMRETALGEQKQGEDDTETVYDMQHKMCDSVSESKYTRFQQLAAIQKHFMEALHKNTVLMNEPDQEADDRLVFEQELQFIKEQKQLVDIEMRDIKVWFAQVQEEQRNRLLRNQENAVDVSGRLTDHFKRKLMNITSYVQNMEQWEKEGNPVVNAKAE